jgi:hypothetical protein
MLETFFLKWSSEPVAHCFKYPSWSEIFILWRCFPGFETNQSHLGPSLMKHFRDHIRFWS